MRWYGKRVQTLQDLRQEYGPLLEGREPTYAFIILLAGRPIGYIQTYRWRDYPEYFKHLGVDEDAAGVDLFIGEADCIHRGLGPSILRRFLREVVFGSMDVVSCIIDPEEANSSAIRAYEKAGFLYLKSVEIPGEGLNHLMRVHREAAVARAPPQRE
jgi:RimJ/RimL family protein N-acetyltransferase